MKTKRAKSLIFPVSNLMIGDVIQCDTIGSDWLIVKSIRWVEGAARDGKWLVETAHKGFPSILFSSNSIVTLQLDTSGSSI